MIDISFLKRPSVLLQRQAGLEFMDWQNSRSFYDELREVLTSAYDAEKKIFDLTKAVRDSVQETIRKYSNISVNVVVSNGLDMSIDAGFINPGNVLNIKDIDTWYDKRYSKVNEAFRDLKKDVIKGWCDPKTGKVEGDFKDIHFNMNFSEDIGNHLDEKTLLKYKCTVPEVISAFVLHECGHAFGGLLYVSSKVIDNAMMAAATKMYVNETDSVRKATILKDTLQALDAGTDVPVADMTEESVMVFFAKNVMNRDYRRSLSIGVAEMTSEVLADAYAIRNGASKQLVAGLAAFPMETTWQVTKWAIFFGILVTIVSSIPLLFTAGTFVIMGNLLLQGGLLVSGTYDTMYRRLKNVLRENITVLGSMTGPKSLKFEMIASLREMETLIEKNKTFFESTSVQRTLGWITSGSDFRKNDFEHYTADLAATTLRLYSENLFA